MKTSIILPLLVVMLFSLMGCMPSAPTELEFKQGKFTDGSLYEKVNAIMVSNCTSCHSNVFAEKGVDLMFANEAELLNSGLIVEGVPLNSTLYQSVKAIDGNLLMPPLKKLSDEDIATIEQYIISLKKAVPKTLAAISDAKSFYDPLQVSVGVRCLEDGNVTFKIHQDNFGTFNQVKTGVLACGKGLTLGHLVPVSTMAGLNSNMIRISLFDGTKDLGEILLTKIPSITTMPAAADACSTTASTVPKFSLKRLSQQQIINIAIDVFAEFGVNANTAVQASAGYLTQDTPNDKLLGTEFFPKNDLSYGKQNIEGISNFFKNVVIELEKNGSFKTTMEAAMCSTLTMANCMNKIVDEVTTRIMRNQLDAATIAGLKTDAAAFSTKYDGIIGLIEFAFLHPRFGFEMYFNNVAAGAVAGSIVTMSDEELFYKSFLTIFNTIPTFAQRAAWYTSGLSYDQFIINLANDNGTMEGKFRSNLNQFFAHWLSLNPVTPIVSKTFANELETIIPLGLQSNFANNSLNGLVSYMSQEVSNGSLDIYSLHFWDSLSVAAMPFEPAMDFAGGDVPLIALPPMLFSTFEYNNIFARGANVYKRLMCGNFSGLGAPSDITGEEEVITNGTREHFESLTPQGSSCMDCHNRFNAIGFNLEAYSVIGAPRNDGYEYQYTAGRAIASSNPIKVDGHLKYLNQVYHTPDVRTFYEELYDKGVLRKCTTKQIGQYFLKMKDQSQYQCALERVNQTGSNDIRQIIFSILTSNAFKKVVL